MGQRLEGFAEHELETDRGVIFARVGGSGPPLLLLEVWRPWARAVTGRGLAASHFLVEDRPEEVVDELSTFFLPGTSTHRAPDPPA